MASYTLRLWLSGLVHLVENKDPNAKCQLCIVLPRADKHIGAIYKADWVVRCGSVRLAKGGLLANLERRRIAFEIDRVDNLPPANTPFQFSAPGILRMEEIAGIFADENPQIVGDEPPKDTVLAQILVGKGYTTGFDPDVSIRRMWTVPSTFMGFSSKFELWDPIYVDIPDVKNVRIIDTPIDSGGEIRKPLELQPNKEGMIEIFVSNRCEGSCLTSDDIDVHLEPSRFVIMQKDRDFAYNYQMFHPETLKAMKKVLGMDVNDVRLLPVPESPLLEITLAPHLCFENGKKKGDDSKKGDGREVASAVSNLVSASTDLMSLIGAKKSEPEFVDIILELVRQGTGTGSGSDCMGGNGKARFNALNSYVPDPEVPPSLALLHEQQKLEKTGSPSLTSSKGASTRQQNEPTGSGGQAASTRGVST